MNRIDSVREHLQREGRWRGGEPEAAPPWYVRLLLGVVAWLAACLLLPWFALIFIDLLNDSDSGMALAMTACLAGCGLMWGRPGSVFLTQLGTALVLAGLAVALFVAADMPGGWLTVAVLAAAAYAGGPGYISRLLCSLVFGGALIMQLAPVADAYWGWALSTAAACGLLGWAAALLWRSEVWVAPRLAAWLEPAAWGLSLAASVAAWYFDGVPGNMAPAEFAALGNTRILAGGACALLPLLCWVAVTFVPEARHTALPGPRARVLVGALLVLLIPTFVTAPGIAFGVAWLILGMAQSRVTLIGFGIVALLTYIARYYYLLHLPLLHKAGWLALAGALVLLAGLALARTRWRQE